MGSSDEIQLLNAAIQGRCLFTFNIADLARLAKDHPGHHGIVLAIRNAWTLSELVVALNRLLATTTAAEWSGQVRSLNEWRDP